MFPGKEFHYILISVSGMYVSYSKINVFMEMCFNNCNTVCNYVIKSRGLNNYVNGVLAFVDVDVMNPDEKSIMTYVAQFLQYSRNMPETEDMQVCNLVYH